MFDKIQSNLRVVNVMNFRSQVGNIIAPRTVINPGKQSHGDQYPPCRAFRGLTTLRRHEGFGLGPNHLRRTRTMKIMLTIVGLLIGVTRSAVPQDRNTNIVTSAPVIFAPGIISGPANDGAPTFSPDGDTLFFGRANNSWSFILESHLVNGVWQQPTVAPFSGQWSDSQPAFSPDGQRLVFVSQRTPAIDPATGMVLGRAAAIWEVDRIGTGWSAPKRLPETINMSSRVFKPTVSADGSLYFMAKTEDAKTWRLYRSKYNKGTYLKAEPLPFSDGNHTDVDPQIAADESFLIFSSAGRGRPDDSHEHLYIVFKKGALWGDIIPLRYEGDYEMNPCDDGEANLGPDQRTLYFNSGRVNPIHKDRTREQAAKDFDILNSWDNSNSNVWTITLNPWLDRFIANN
jgi:dipeptidyl aminopeptidase/acylaminoacyl peptidase